MAKITILGSGGWGTALAITAFDSGHDVTLWSPFEAEVEMLSRLRTNEKLLKGVVIPEDIKITTDRQIATIFTDFLLKSKVSDPTLQPVRIKEKSKFTNFSFENAKYLLLFLRRCDSIYLLPDEATC